MIKKQNKVARGPVVRVYPYKQGSASAKKLAEAMGGKVLKHVGSKYNPRAGDLVINWGASGCPVFPAATRLNAPEAVKAASCKLASFTSLKENGVRTPVFTTDKDVAKGWGTVVVCRTKLTGHSGAGIVMANTPDEVVDAPLYTQYVKKKDEFRVHVLNGGAFFVQRKARKLDNENPNWQVRNLAGGFAFVEVEDVPADVIQQAVDAAAALNLDFGGVDVMWNEREQQAYVLEINTACGLEERTAEKYVEAFQRFL
jgi:glutathione synthase/RimK-type ligase-like ATP-grasp enzyme